MSTPSAHANARGADLVAPLTADTPGRVLAADCSVVTATPTVAAGVAAGAVAGYVAGQAADD